jgi:hypothetical protein
VNFAAIATWLFTPIRALGSAVDGPHNAVIMGGRSPVPGYDETAETADAQNSPAYGAPGLVWRPRPPTSHDGEELAAEAVGARLGEGLFPLAWRDLRLNRRYPAPKPGTFALVGYGGGFVALDDVPNEEHGTLTTLYCPYEFDGAGVPAKAHAIVLDPAQKALSLIHGDGFAVVLSEDGITMRGDGSTFLSLKAGELTVVASKINLRGNVALGADTTVAVPLLPGAASQPTPSVFFSPT